MVKNDKKPQDEPSDADPRAATTPPAPPGGAGAPGPAAPVDVGPEGGPDDPAQQVCQALKAERDDLLARLQRVAADYVNYQKRIQKDLNQTREYANESLIKALLPVLDDMDRALKAGWQHAKPEDPLLKGMQLVHDKALGVLGSFGLVAVEAEGRPFDPEVHQAVTMHPTRKMPPQTVLAELQKGYQLKGRTIRPASVVVAVAPQTPDED